MKRSPEEIRQLIQQVNQIRIRYPLFNTILAEMQRCFDESVDYPEPLCMLITGEAGVGKSTLLTTFHAANMPFASGDRTETPVLLASVPLPATIAGLFTSLLSSLQAPFPDRGNIEYKRRRLIELLERCRTRLVILDEFQHLVERGTRQRIEAVADAIKSLINATRIPFVLTGVPGAQAVLEFSPQLAGRFPLRVEIPVFNWLQRPEDFKRLLACYEQALPFDTPSGFNDRDVCARFYLATGGNLRFLTTLVRDASRTALMQDCVRIEREHLVRSFDKLLANNRRLQANPFRESETTIDQWVALLRERRDEK